MSQKLGLNRLVKLGISAGVYVFTSAADFILGLIGYKRSGRCVVLYYHSIPPDQREQFIRQLDIIQRRAQPLDVSQTAALKRGEKYVGITFDDAFENYATVALPELLKRNMPSTVFVITDALGKAFGPPGRAEVVMTDAEVRALPSDLVTIGSHTRTHPFLPSLSLEEAKTEIASSGGQLESKFGRGGALFSFPFGGFNEDLIRLCRDAGYTRVFTTLPYFAFEDPQEFAVGRVRVDPTDTPMEFRLKLAGAYRWLPLAFSLKRSLLANPLVRLLAGNAKTLSTGGRLSVIQE